METFVQFVLSGLTVGAVYALIALGFTLIYNASHVINFSQGEFVMLGGLSTVFLFAAGVPLALAILISIAAVSLLGLALYRFAIQPAKDADIVTLIIITIGASILLRGLAPVIFDRRFHFLPAFSDQPIHILGASLHPQAPWMLGALVLIVAGMGLFFGRTLFGKAMLATAANRLAARMVGINVPKVMLASFGIAAAIGAIGGILITPIQSMVFNIGVFLALKGFAGAILGGLGSVPGAIVGGLLVGIAEQLGAGYVSSQYKDAVAFIIILLVLFVRPAGLFGKAGVERV